MRFITHIADKQYPTSNVKQNIKHEKTIVTSRFWLGMHYYHLGKLSIEQC